VSIQFDFLRVLPADIGRVGPLGACVLALVRYATAIDDGRHGRGTDADGEVWWRASHAGMAEALEVSHDSIYRVVSKLETASELEVFDPKDSSDRSFYYRVPDLSLRETASASTSHNAKSRCHNAKSRRPNAKSRSPLREIALCTIPLKNLKEVEEVREPHAHADAELASLPREPKSPPGKAKTSKTSKTRNRNPVAPLPDDFTVPDSEIDKILARFPKATRAAIDRETFKFINHYQDNGAHRPNWLASWRKWMANADSYGHFTANDTYANNDDKVAGWASVGITNTRKAIG
jgi:hypothetical protein